MMRRTIFKVLVIFALLNILVWAYLLVKWQFGNKKTTVVNPYRDFNIKKIKLPDFSIGDEQEENHLNSRELSDGINIVIFFTFEDCSSCLFEARFWSKAAKMFSDEVKFFGIVNEWKDDYISDFVKEYQITFPIIADESNRLKTKILSLKDISNLGIITPFKVYICDNYIIHIDGPQKSPEKQERFLERVKMVLENKSK